MLKEMLKKISTKAFYIVFAIVVSVVLWMYVEITENDLQTRDIDVRVVFRNEDVLNDRGLLVSNLVTENILITFEGARSEITKLTSEATVTAEVNLANIPSAGTHALDYTIVYSQGINRNAISIRGASASRVTMVIDRLLERHIDVKVNYTGGTASDDIIVLPAEFDPQVITVSGPEEVISQISHANVPILRENLSASITEDFDLVLIKMDGEELDISIHDSVSISHETIRVTIPIRLMKTVPLHVDLSQALTATQSNTTLKITPEFITVSGDPDVIRDLNQIMLGTIDMLSFGVSATRTFPIIIPNYISNVSGENEATVLVEVLGVDIAFISVTNLQVINVPPGHRAEIVTLSTDVRVRGTEADLAQILSINLRVVADLTDLGTGTTSILSRAHISGVDVDVEPVGETRIVVSIFSD